MTFKKVIEDSRYAEIIEVTDENRRYFDFAEEVKESTSYVESRCNFIKGECEGNRRLSVGTNIYSKTGCCAHCKTELGYWRNVPSNLIEMLNKHWDDEKGFLGPKGCKLPLGARSSTCVAHICSAVYNNLSVRDKDLLTVISRLED